MQDITVKDVVNCAVLARVSLERQAESVEHQVSLLREFVKSRELGEIPENCIYEDVGVSATKYSIWQRPAIKRLLHDANEGKFQIVLFKGISRFARNTQEALDVLDRLKAKGLRVISYEENYDSAKENSNFMFTMHAAMAEYEAEKTAIRVRLGNKEKARSGEWVGEPPFGYNLDNSKLIIDENNRHIIETVFKMYVEEGFGTFKIAEYLNENKWFGKSGALWARKTIADILKNEAYIGNIVYNKTRQFRVRDYDSVIEGKKKWKRTVNDPKDWVIVEGAHDAIIEKGVFMKAKKLLMKRGEKQGVHAPNVQHPLTGILVCGKCGEGMVCQKRTVSNKVYRYYICKTYHKYGRSYCDQGNTNAEALEKYVCERLEEQVRALLDRQRFNSRVMKTDADSEKVQTELNEIARKIEKIKKDTTDLFLQRDNFAEEQYDAITKRLKDEMTRLTARRNDLERQLEVKIDEEAVIQEVTKRIEEYLSFDRVDMQKLRQLLHYFIDRVTIKGTHVEIFYTFEIVDEDEPESYGQ